MVANGEAQPREDEPVLDRAGIERALAEADLASITAARDQLLALRSAIGAIQATTTDKAGYDQAVSLERLPALVDRMLAVLGPIVATRDPAATAPTAETAGDTASGRTVEEAGGRVVRAVTSIEGATAALAAAARYFQQCEPSSPAALLLRQAETLVGKSFLDVIRALVPNHVDDAVIGIGADRLFTLSFNQLSELAADPPAPEDSPGNVSSETSATDSQTSFSAGTRGEALALMQDVAAFYRSAEPSSPIPLLLERAAGMVDRDFLSLLKDVLPRLASRE
jgi:type VI secretion system protein ImpA